MNAFPAPEKRSRLFGLNSNSSDLTSVFMNAFQFCTAMVCLLAICLQATVAEEPQIEEGEYLLIQHLNPEGQSFTVVTPGRIIEKDGNLTFNAEMTKSSGNQWKAEVTPVYRKGNRVMFSLTWLLEKHEHFGMTVFMGEVNQGQVTGTLIMHDIEGTQTQGTWLLYRNALRMRQ